MVNRSIVNALGCLLTIVLISGCTSMPKQIEVSVKPIDKPKLVLPNADELDLRSVEWYIVTIENWEEQYEKLVNSGRSLAFFSLTDKGYENLGLNISDLRAYIQQQNAIIGAYDAYYLRSEETFDKANAEAEEAFEEQTKESEKGFFGRLID